MNGTSVRVRDGSGILFTEHGVEKRYSGQPDGDLSTYTVTK